VINRKPSSNDVHPPGVASEFGLGKSGASLRPGLISVLALVLLALALLVVIELPNRIDNEVQPVTSTKLNSAPVAEQHSDPTESKSISDTETNTKPATATAQDIIPDNSAQKEAERVLQGFLRQRAQPDLQNMESWASEQWSKARDLAEQGDDLYGRRRFKDAAAAYQRALQGLHELRAARPQILLDTLASARTQLKNNAIEPAIKAYERVLLMQADHAQAKQELAQSRVRESILALMEQGRLAGRLSDEKLAYEAALKLDPAYQKAQIALQTVIEEQNRLAYQKAMSQVLNHLQSGKLRAAKAALKTASGIRPDAPEVKDAAQRLLDAQRQASLNRLRQQADKFTAQENWADAATHYKKALTIDPQATFAGSGLEHAESRLKLHSQLDHYLNSPQRLSSDAPLDNARKLLAANLGVPQGEPGLAEKIESLKTTIDLATRAVELTIESDTLTDVTIYHVGRLGRFSRKQVELRPGIYTVTGSCTGYRDVRKVITLEPGMQTATVHIRCEEAI
jgi:tetratricopeptide (TPR) repeat protein